MKVVAIHQPQYLPYSGFFNKAANCDEYIVLDDALYPNRGLINRNQIKGPNGAQWLTVPVKNIPEMSIAQAQIADDGKWRRKHWAAVRANYGKAPFFKQYAEELEAQMQASESPSLSAEATRLNLWFFEKLGIAPTISYSARHAVEGTSTERLVNLCKVAEATHYLSGPGGRNYMDLSLFSDAGIEVLWQEHSTAEYEQLFPKSGFIENLSIIDPLMNLGPECAAWLGVP